MTRDHQRTVLGGVLFAAGATMIAAFVGEWAALYFTFVGVGLYLWWNL